MADTEQLVKGKQNTVYWKQNEDNVTIQVFEISLNRNKNQLTNLFTELKSRNVMFTLKISRNNL